MLRLFIKAGEKQKPSLAIEWTQKNALTAYWQALQVAVKIPLMLSPTSESSAFWSNTLSCLLAADCQGEMEVLTSDP